MKFILPLILCLFLSGCSVEQYTPNSNTVFGKWQLISYIDGQEIPFDVTIELKSETDSSGKYIIHGKSPLNFYFSTFEIDFATKGIRLFDIQITKVEGEINAASFESKYYETLSKVINYELSNEGKTMKLLLPESENQHLIYSHIP